MFHSIVRLKVFVAPYKVRLSVGIIAFGLARLAEAMVPLFLAIGIDRLIEGNSDLVMPVFGIAVSVLARYVIVTFARFFVRSTAHYVGFDLRQALYESLQYQGATFFGRYSVGDLMTRAVADIGLVQRLIAMGTILMVILVYATLIGFGFMLYLSPVLTLLLIPPLPFVFWYARHSALAMGVASKDVQDRLSDLGSHVQENLSGIRTIQAMVQEESEIKRFGKTNQSYADAFYQQAKVNSLMMAWMPALAAICSITILGYGGFLVLEGEMKIGEFTAFFMYVNMVVQPFRVAGFMVNLYQRAAVASDRLFEVLDLKPEITDAPTGVAPARIKGNIELKNLSYRYPGAERDELSNINMYIQQGETVAIMGRVGAGKTTLLKQLVRLLDTPPGVVFIDGVDVCDYPLAQLRSQVAMVPQDPFLFGEPLKDNLTYDDPKRALDLIWQAAESADFKDTIESFPNAMLTLVGERGVTLSGGQKQRATLARGLIRNAPVLILDDCFSAVDTETEEHILSQLKKLRRNQTTLLVSHRVSTARHANRIVILEAGQIVEMGSHLELINLRGRYAELERIQREGAVDADLQNVKVPT